VSALDGVQTVRAVRGGHAFVGILQYAVDHAIDMVVMGTRGRGPVEYTAGQGKHPLQPRGGRRRSPGPARADDLPVRDREVPFAGAKGAVQVDSPLVQPRGLTSSPRRTAARPGWPGQGGVRDDGASCVLTRVPRRSQNQTQDQ